MNVHATTLQAPPALPRAKGCGRISVRRRGARTVLERLHQSGSAKALLPRTFEDRLTAVLLNTAGGVTGGDRFDWQADAAPRAALTLTTQTAERLYRALPGTLGRVATRLRAGTGATLHWLPQETIAFDGAALTRSLDVDLTGDATLLAVEPLILGRAAMGETVRDLRLTDQWRVRRDGRLIFADTLRIIGDPQALNGPATLGGHRAVATILLAAPDADRHLAALREAIGPTGGASLIRDGVLLARMTAPDGLSLRKTLIPALRLLGGADLPRPWSL